MKWNEEVVKRARERFLAGLEAKPRYSATKEDVLRIQRRLLCQVIDLARYRKNRAR